MSDLGDQIQTELDAITALNDGDAWGTQYEAYLAGVRDQLNSAAPDTIRNAQGEITADVNNAVTNSDEGLINKATVSDTFLTERTRPTGDVSYGPIGGSFGNREKGTIALETDDARIETHDYTRQMMRDRGLPWSIAVPVDSIGGPDHCSWSQLEKLESHGVEMCVHSGGVDVPLDSDEAVYHELVEQLDVLESHGMSSKRLVCSGNPDFEDRRSWDTYGGRLTLSLYDTVGGVKRRVASKDAHGGLVGGHYDQRHQIGGMAQSDAETLIDIIAATKGCMTLYWHPHELGNVGKMTRAEIQAVMDKIASMRANDQINVVTPTVSQLMEGDPKSHHVNAFPELGDSTVLQSTDSMPGSWHNRTGDVTINTSQAYVGTNSFEIPAGGGISQVFSVPNATTRMVVEARAKSKNVGSPGTLRTYNNATNNYPDYDGLLGLHDQDTTDTWDPASSAFGIHRDMTALKIDLRNVGSNPILLDDIYVYPA